MLLHELRDRSFFRICQLLYFYLGLYERILSLLFTRISSAKRRHTRLQSKAARNSSVIISVSSPRRVQWGHGLFREKYFMSFEF